jgi:hypothetical protein
MSELREDALTTFFNRIDNDGNGTIDAQELLNGINTLFITPLSTQISIRINPIDINFISHFDENGNNEFERGEIRAIIESCIERIIMDHLELLFPQSPSISRLFLHSFFNLIFNGLTAQQAERTRDMINGLARRNASRHPQPLPQPHPQPQPEPQPRPPIEVPIPDEFICPISQDIMIDPVKASDGHTYDRDQISAWFNAGHRNSPLSNVVLTNLNLQPNVQLRQAIQSFIARTGRSLPRPLQIQAPIETDPTIERHRLEQFTHAEILELQRLGLLHAQRLLQRYPRDTEQDTQEISRDYFLPYIIQDNRDPGWVKAILRNVYQQLFSIDQHRTHLLRRVAECIEYTPSYGGGYRQNKLKK